MKFTNKDLLADKCTSEQYYSQFVDSEVIRIVKTSTTCKHILRTKQEDYVGLKIEQAFMNITVKQWDCVTANILCYLKFKYKKEDTFTQSKLFIIAKLAAIKILEETGQNKCLTGNV